MTLVRQGNDVLSIIADDPPWLRERLAAEIPTEQLITAWRDSADARTVLAKVFQIRREAAAVDVLADAVSGPDEELRGEALLALGRIGSPSAKDAIRSAPVSVREAMPALLLEVARSAGVAEYASFAEARLTAVDPVVRWRAFQLLISLDVAVPDSLLQDVIDTESDPIWRQKLVDAADEKGIASCSPIPIIRRRMVVHAPLSGDLPVELKIMDAGRGPTSRRYRVVWEVDSEYGPLRIDRRLVLADRDVFAAHLSALAEVHTFLANSYELHRGWIALPGGRDLTLEDFEVES